VQRSASGFGIAAWIALSVAILATLVFWQPPFLRSLGRLAFLNLTQVLPPQLTATTIVVLGVSAALAAFAVVAVHELGHVLGGILTGYRFESMRIGPLQFDRPFRISRY